MKPVSLPKTAATVARTPDTTPAAQVAAAAPIASAAPVAGGAGSKDVDETRVAGVATAYVKPAATPDRVQTLLQAAGDMLEALEDYDVKTAMTTLAKTGVTADMHVGTALTAPSDEQRVEWYVGQLAHLASEKSLEEGFSYRWLSSLAQSGQGLAKAPFGTSLIAEIEAREQKLAGVEKDFRRDQKKDGLAVSGSNEYQKYFGSFHGHTLNGTQGAFLVQDWQSGTSKVHSGIVRPAEGWGDAPFRVETAQGLIDLNLNDVTAYALETPQLGLVDDFHKAAKKAGFISSRDPEYADLFGNGWFSAHALAGHEAKFLAFDSKTKTHAVHEGVIQVDPNAGGNALFFLDTATGRRALNINDMDETWLADRSAIPLDEIVAKAKKAGMTTPSGWFDAHALDGKKAWIVTVDKAAKAYVLTEGVIHPDPKSTGNALYLLETDKGTFPANINDAKKYWVQGS